MKLFFSVGVILCMFSFLFGSSFFCEVVAKDGAKVNIEVGSLEHSIFGLRGGGFKPYEVLNVISNSCNEILYTQTSADENGNFPPTVLLPAVIGETGGMSHIDILREEGSIHLKFPWGTEALKGKEIMFGQK